jgi:nucleoside-diphosphate-sugar epimerase
VSSAARVLVTGAAGFIGAHCVRFLAARGCRVRALDVHAAPADFAALGIEFAQADLRDAKAIGAALQDIEVVFHLASVHLDVAATYQEFEAVNVKAVAALVSACAAASVRRLVHVSSVGVYGHIEHPPADESAPLHPQNDYERTKRAGEDAARQCAARVALDLVIVRPSWVYGEGCPRTEKLIEALRRRRFFYIGAARNLRHPVYIADFLEGLWLAAIAGPEIAGATFNIAGPKWMTVQEMVATFAAALQVPPPTLRIPRWLGYWAGWAAEIAGGILRINPPISRRTLAFFENDNAFDISAAQSRLKYQPRTGLLEGVRAVLRNDPRLAATPAGSAATAS